MYKTFQGMDDLQNMVEQAHGVPFGSNCMVPRQEVLEILDEMRNAIPIEMDDAQDVLDHKDSIIVDAQQEADAMVSEAQAERDDILREAQARADEILRDAEERSINQVARAEEEAHRLLNNANREYEQLTSRAEAEADRLVAAGNESYQRSVDEGIAEQNRLVSDSEVVRRAEDEAQRIVSSAHADSDRLRQECDRYVDSTLAEFEESLSNVLRTVGRDRSALRKGAGAAGYGQASGRSREHREPRDTGQGYDYSRQS